MSERKVRLITLPKDDWESLDKMAEKFKCLPAGGPRPTIPSVTTLLRFISRGRLRIRRTGR